MPSHEELIGQVLRYENLSTLEIAKRINISQPTVSRVLAKMPVIKLGGGRTTTFALLEKIKSETLFQVDEAGTISQLGELFFLTQGRTVLVQGKKHHNYDGLPFYLYDALPAGFLGSITLNNIIKHDRVLTTKSQEWSDDQILHYLSNYGDDLSGNLILSEHAAEQASKLQHRIVNRSQYSTITRDINQSPDSFGSSVAGEQPKFTIYNGQEHLIVKYSPLLSEDNPVARRHRDLMVCEHLALKALQEHGITASGSDLYIDDRVYLEIKRFDRIAAHGRTGVISLKSIDAEYAGDNSNWPNIAKVLLAQKRISEEDLHTIEVVYAFGRHIANTDMHNGNFSFFMRDLNLTVVAPVYDMLPMAFMPAQGELRNPKIEMARFVNVSQKANQQAINIAIDFWKSVQNSELISQDFKSITEQLTPL